MPESVQYDMAGVEFCICEGSDKESVGWLGGSFVNEPCSREIPMCKHALVVVNFVECSEVLVCRFLLSYCSAEKA